MEQRPCRHCGFAFYSNGRRMEVCWSEEKRAWLCLNCHLTPNEALDDQNTDTPPKRRGAEGADADLILNPR